ncbi:ICU11 [Symbiodinium microadriaticum]|nr:ICU11 [Symbiodinium microadriaticum]CAE7932695.1 ICU11 [Symbiodinium sp. KB8]
MLSRYFASKHNSPSPEDRVQASLADVADGACRTLHSSSQRHKPCARQLLEGLPQADRQETLTWMAQAFEVMSFPDTLLFDTALLLDRYYASLPKEDCNTAESQRRLLAAVCVALKTGSNAEPQLPLRQVVAHLGHDEVPFDDVIAAELIILRKLRFDVGTPTSRDFLEALGARLSNFQAPDRAQHLADFLLQLSLADAGLHYRYPHSMLAAAALLLALSVTCAPAAAQTAVLEDLELHFPEAADQHATLANCGRDLQSLWLMIFANQENMYLNHIRLKFSRANYRSVSTVRPPGAPIAIVPSKAPGMSGVGQPEEQHAAPRLSKPSLDSSVIPRHDEGAAKQGPISFCLPCGRVWKLPDPHNGLCTHCGSQVEVVDPEAHPASQLQWATLLSARLRILSQASWKVRGISAEHTCPPDHVRPFQFWQDAEIQKNALDRAGRSTAAMDCTGETDGNLAAARALKTSMPEVRKLTGGDVEGHFWWEKHEELLEAARKELGPLHEDVYHLCSSRGSELETASCLLPALRQALADASPAALRSQLVEVCRDAAGYAVYRFDIFAPDWCDRVLAELDHLEASGIPLRRPNGMNRYGAILSNLGFQEGLLQPLMRLVVKPLARELWPEWVDPMDCNETYGFVVRYRIGEDVELAEHADTSNVTLNVCLGKEFSGGELYFKGVRFTPSQDDVQEHSVFHSRGSALIHLGGHYHGARPITSGERSNLILWGTGDGGQVRIRPATPKSEAMHFTNNSLVQSLRASKARTYAATKMTSKICSADRRPRAASWCGQRLSARTVVPAQE